MLQCCVACVALLGKENLQHVHEETPFIVGFIYQVLVTVYAELYMVPGTHLSQPSAFWEKRWDGLVGGYENCTINYSCLGVPCLFLQAPENAGTALVLHASGFVSFLLAFCVVCVYFCLAMIFVSFSLTLCVVHAMNFS